MTTPSTCRNCGGTELHTCEVSAGGVMSPDLMPIGFLHGGRYRLTICGTCGLTEWFVPPEFLGKVRETFERVS
jgi:hypothetical protein